MDYYGILINEVESESKNDETEETLETGTDAILNDFSIEDLVKNAIYSVVGISKISEPNTSIFVEDAEEKLGLGSGVILTSNGYILTNQSITGDIRRNCLCDFKKWRKLCRRSCLE